MILGRSQTGICKRPASVVRVAQKQSNGLVACVYGCKSHPSPTSLIQNPADSSSYPQGNPRRGVTRNREPINYCGPLRSHSQGEPHNDVPAVQTL